MDARKLSPREEHIKKIFIPDVKSDKKNYLEEDKVLEIIDKISDIGNKIGFVGIKKSNDENKNEKRKHKYDVWLAKEIKKDLSLLDRFSEINLIIDWAINSKSDIFKYSFQEALNQQKEWHKKMLEKYKIQEFNFQNIDENRILYRCQDNYFFYLLKAEDLSYEGKMMKHCVGLYTSKVNNEDSLIISLRDEKNEPHVTVEIALTKKDKVEGRVIQQSGKANGKIKKEYKKKIIEFILFCTGYDKLPNKEILNFLNLNYL